MQPVTRRRSGGSGSAVAATTVAAQWRQRRRRIFNNKPVTRQREVGGSGSSAAAAAWRRRQTHDAVVQSITSMRGKGMILTGDSIGHGCTDLQTVYDNCISASPTWGTCASCKGNEK